MSDAEQPFELLIPDHPDHPDHPDDLGPDSPERAQRRDALARRRLPASLTSHAEAAKHYRPDPDLVDAINTALAVAAPLLLTGEPGTGKTQVAYYLAHYFGLDPDKDLRALYVRSTTTAEDLLYEFDAVAYLHTANDPQRRDAPITRAEFVRPGPLWAAYESPRPSVVLIDEIDKAPRDFPNDLLNVIDQHSFRVKETGQTVCRPEGMAPPVVVITSNSERRLPEPFLRRCIFHHIELTRELVRRAVAGRIGDFPSLSDELRELALARFFDLRGRDDLRKRPATAELLTWLAILSARVASGRLEPADLRDVPLVRLPALSALIKSRDDWDALS